MKQIFFSFMILFAFSRCSHSPSDFNNKPFVILRFQNMVGLQNNPTGCSLGGLGGITSMETYALSHPVDLSFQVGPAFSPLITGPFSEEELAQERRRLWQSWKNQGIAFYAVDAEDLLPSVKAFHMAAEGLKLPLLSTNLFDPTTKSPLFKTEWVFRVSGKSVLVLSLSEVATPRPDFKVLPPLEAFTKKLSELPKEIDSVFVVGALKKETRAAISKVSTKPLLFLGGTSQEKNTTQIEKLEAHHFFGRSPAFGTGFSEIMLGNFQRDPLGKTSQARLGSFHLSLYSDLLGGKEKSGAGCVPSSTSR